MTVGMNVDPDHECAAPPAERLLQSGFRGVRLTARPSDANKQYVAQMLEAGLQVVAVVATGDNEGYVPPQREVILQIFNEPDLPGPIAPTAMSPSAYATLFAAWRAGCPGYTLWTAGLAARDRAASYYRQFLIALTDLYSSVASPDLSPFPPGVALPNAPDLKGCLTLPDAVAIHPYEEDPSGLVDLAEQHWNAATELTGAGIPVVSTEWFQAASPDGRDLITPFQDALNKPDTGVCTVWNSFFGWCSAMAPELGGAVVSPVGTCLPEGPTLIAAIGGDSSWCGTPAASS